MQYIKKFENFDLVVSKNDNLPVLCTIYYHCDSCNALWKEFSNTVDKCKFCSGNEVEELSEDEWYDTVDGRLGEDVIEESILREEEQFLDLDSENGITIDENNSYYVN
jgi:hypothetical protein